VLAAGSLLTLVACGEDSTANNDQPTGTIAPPVLTPAVPTTAAPPGIEHPTGADEAVIEIIFEGGFVPADFAFRNLPLLLVSGNGSHFTQGPQIAIFPGPMLPNVLVSDIGEPGVQQLLDLAAEHGLLTQRAYERNDMIADASDTVVRISANGETYEHRAYALGMGAGVGDDSVETGDRAELQAFIDAAISTSPADAVGFEPQTFLVRATPVTDTSGYDVEPTIAEWSIEGVTLADAADCVAIPATDVQELFSTANQLTFFTEADVTYQLSVRPQLPGDLGC